jgi:hypothetical protein
VLERVPIKWNHLIDSDAAQNQTVGDVGSEKGEQLFLVSSRWRIFCWNA